MFIKAAIRVLATFTSSDSLYLATQPLFGTMQVECKPTLAPKQVYFLKATAMLGASATADYTYTLGSMQ